MLVQSFQTRYIEHPTSNYWNQYPKTKGSDIWISRLEDSMLLMPFVCIFQVFTEYFGELDYRVYMAIILIPMILLVCIRNLRYLSPVSMLANLLQFVGLAIIFYYLLRDIPSIRERKTSATWAQLPLYFGTAIYAFEGIGVVLPLENSMKHPEDMKVRIITKVFTFSTISCSSHRVGMVFLIPP